MINTVQVKEDLTGKTFGRLTVLKQVEDYIDPKTKKRRSQWLCECSCDEHNQIVVSGNRLKRKNGTKSCGCLQKEIVRNASKKENIFDMESEEYAIGYTSKGEPFWFDKEDYNLVKQHCWRYDNYGYVVATINGKKVYLHRLIMNTNDPKIYIDHANHPPRNEHKIDNRKSNLRFATFSQNHMNRIPSQNNTSGKMGVSWDKSRNKWVARIYFNKKEIHLGYFSNKEDAIRARKEAEIKYFGEYRYDANNK